jgi:hypothetical protein
MPAGAQSARHPWRVKTQGLSRVNSRYASISTWLLPRCQAPVAVADRQVPGTRGGSKLRVCPELIRAMQAFPGGCFQVPGTHRDG